MIAARRLSAAIQRPQRQQAGLRVTAPVKSRSRACAQRRRCNVVQALTNGVSASYDYCSEYLDTALDLCNLIDAAECTLDKVENMLAHIAENEPELEMCSAICAALQDVESGLAQADLHNCVLHLHNSFQLEYVPEQNGFEHAPACAN